MAAPVQTTETVNLGVSSRIRSEDAAELRWFFSDPLLTFGSRSGCGIGHILERAEVFGLAYVPCRKCGGDPKRDLTGTGFSPREGKYAVELRKFRKREAKRLGLRLVTGEETAQRWNALGVPAATPEQIAEWLPLKLCRPCPNCKATGIVQGRRSRKTAITARPTGSSVHGVSHAKAHLVDEAALARYGRLSRLLERVRGQSAEARLAIAAYYGPDGGNVTALWHLTEAGARLAADLPNPHHVSHEALLANEREAQRASPSTDRQIKLGRVAREASELWDHACKVWNGVRG